MFAEFARNALSILARRFGPTPETGPQDGRISLLQTLDGEQTRWREAVRHHEHQRDYFGRLNGDQQFIRIHDIEAQVCRTEVTRVGYEKEIVQTGKSFWELYDINEWATRAPQSARDARYMSFWGELPTSAIAPLHQLIEQRRRDQRTREFEAERRWTHEQADGLAAEKLLNFRDSETYSAVTKLVSQAREALLEQRDHAVNSEVLVQAAHEAYKSDPTNTDISDIIASAKRKMVHGQQSPRDPFDLHH